MDCSDDIREFATLHRGDSLPHKFIKPNLLSFPLRAQKFITFMDALRLKLRAKDQLHPILQELMTGYARFKGSKEWEGRNRMVSWSVTPLL